MNESYKKMCLHASWINFVGTGIIYAGRVEPDGLDTAFSSRNDICASNISPGRKIGHVDYYAWTKKEIF